MTVAKKEWLIYNADYGQFWGPDAGGYFGLWGAGFYTEEVARSHASNRDRRDQVHHISEYKDQIANMRGAFERLSAALNGDEEFCLGCNKSTELRDCGCPAGTARRPMRPTAEVGGEVCICAAIKMPDGYVVRGHRHGDCIITAIGFARYDKLAVSKGTQGFLTTTDRFVDREEGMRLMRATDWMARYNEHNWMPFKDLPATIDALFSEHLY